MPKPWRNKQASNQDRNIDPGERVVSWGVHKWRHFKDVPTSYLEWFVKNAYNQMVDRKRWTEEELERRIAESINKTEV